jgi:hypothetical protein
MEIELKNKPMVMVLIPSEMKIKKEKFLSP